MSNSKKLKKLQILIPHYKETEKELKPLLASLDIQQQINFNDIGVIIANDGPESEKLSDNFLNSFNYEVIQVNAPKGGVSATRNAALDKATAEFVMFCDADDMFMNACGLYILFREMESTKQFDFLISTFVEETRDMKTKTPVYVNHDIDFTFVHGKVIRREFLKEEKIRWNPDLTIHEDSYFNMLCFRLSKEVKHCRTPFYLWRWRDDSVCRHDPKYMLKTYKNMLESSTCLVKELSKRGKLEAASEIVVQLTYDSYFTMNKNDWLDQENQNYRIETEKRFAKYYDEFKLLYESVPEEKKNQLLIGIKNRFFQEGVLFEDITFKDWMKHIQSL